MLQKFVWHAFSYIFDVLHWTMLFLVAFAQFVVYCVFNGATADDGAIFCK